MVMWFAGDECGINGVLQMNGFCAVLDWDECRVCGPFLGAWQVSVGKEVRGSRGVSSRFLLFLSFFCVCVWFYFIFSFVCGN